MPSERGGGSTGRNSGPCPAVGALLLFTWLLAQSSATLRGAYAAHGGVCSAASLG